MTKIQDLVICKCGTKYRSTTKFTVVEGEKKIITTKLCPQCLRNDNFSLLTSTKEDRQEPTQEENMAWSRLEAEHQARPHYPKLCFDEACAECKSLGYRNF